MDSVVAVYQQGCQLRINFAPVALAVPCFSMRLPRVSVASITCCPVLPGDVLLPSLALPTWTPPVWSSPLL